MIMSLVRLENITKFFAGQPVLDKVDFRVEDGEKIGLIGRNGTGKTTVFRLITGEIPPDSGTVERMRKMRVACLRQIPQVGPTDTIFDVVMHSFADLQSMERELNELEHRMSDGDPSVMKAYSRLQDTFSTRGGYTFRTRVKQVLHGLGFTTEDFDLAARALSGGQTTRLMLALVLLEDADLLLLDEPENHLDLSAREWLETFLKAWPRALVIISHDRRMLNIVAERIVEVERCELVKYTGNYDAYLGRKALLREQHEKAFTRQQEFIQKEEAWINRFRYKETKARQVQSRIKRLEKLERVEPPAAEAKTMRLRTGDVVRSGAAVITAKDLAMAYGDLSLYADVSLALHRGERIGLIGPNGSGKTTLLRHLAGRLEGGHGHVRLGHKVSLGFYEQKHESMNQENHILAEIQALRPDFSPEQVRTFMGRFLFTGDDIFKRIGTLSGGELSRVAIAKLILSQANVLLLDEPTNHLDIASREALEGALAEFPGSMVIVSHDRALIDRLVENLVIVADGKATFHQGNYSRYRWKCGEKADDTPAATSDEAMRIRKKTPKQKTRVEANQRRKLRRELEGLEHDIEALEQLVEEREAAFAHVDPADYEKAQSLKDEYEAMKRDLQDMYAEWERLADDLAE